MARRILLRQAGQQHDVAGGLQRARIDLLAGLDGAGHHRVSDALSQVEAVGDDGLQVSSRAATILARRMGKAPSVHSPEGMAERSVRN
jgi:hypothetical protein